MKMSKLLVNTIAILVVGFLLVSCDRNEESQIESVSAIKIDSVKIAQDTMDVFTVQTIKTYSSYGDGCHRFYGYDYRRNGFTRNVVAYEFAVKGICTQATYVGTNGFIFRPEEKGTYVFRFWKGKDSNNQDIWIDKNVVVQ